MSQARHFALHTADGYAIAATEYLGTGKRRGMIVLGAAMGVPQDYYAAFATWLASHGWTVVTFDYRGMGKSRRGSLRGFVTDLNIWAEQDCAAIAAYAIAEAGDGKLLWIGHSLGGQLPGLIPGMARFDRIITIAAGSGYWRENVPALKRRVWLLWFILAPLLTPLFGYFPGKRLGMVGDLPAGVIRQWRRWCLSPTYLAGAETRSVATAYANLQVPITSLSFTDDELMSERNIVALHALYTTARPAMTRVAPADAGLKRIGHFGFFREQYREPLWERYLSPLIARDA